MQRRAASTGFGCGPRGARSTIKFRPSTRRDIAREPYLSKLQGLVAECDRRGMIVDVTLSRGNGITGPATTADAGRTPPCGRDPRGGAAAPSQLVSRSVQRTQSPQSGLRELRGSPGTRASGPPSRPPTSGHGLTCGRHLPRGSGRVRADGRGGFSGAPPTSRRRFPASDGIADAGAVRLDEGTRAAWCRCITRNLFDGDSRLSGTRRPKISRPTCVRPSPAGQPAGACTTAINVRNPMGVPAAPSTCATQDFLNNWMARRERFSTSIFPPCCQRCRPDAS